jgi:hypothetical protein
MVAAVSSLDAYAVASFRPLNAPTNSSPPIQPPRFGAATAQLSQPEYSFMMFGGTTQRRGNAVSFEEVSDEMWQYILGAGR